MQSLQDVDACVDAVLARVGKRVLIATPLGLGKPNHLLNAFYRRARADPSIELAIMTALTLQRPQGHSELERRFLEPFVQRVFGDYPDLDYELDRVAQRLPPNVRVFEFYVQAGKWLHNPAAQRDYISTNYSLVARDLIDRGVNVIAQQVCRGTRADEAVVSLSCNPDLTLELVERLRASGRTFALAAQINQELPFMLGEAVVPEASWDFVVDEPKQYYRLFALPKTAVSDAEYMIGLYASTLIKDGGSLQIGIGSLGDALVYALKLRHEHNPIYLELLERLRIRERFGATIEREGDTGVFRRGLFAPTEMLVDGFMHLMQAGILSREVYDDAPLQRLVGAGETDGKVTPALLDRLIEEKVVPAQLDDAAFRYLQFWGVLRESLRFEQGNILCADGTRIGTDLRRAENRRSVAEHCLGASLRHGRVAHAGFFIGPPAFYQWLRQLPDAQRERIDMRGVSRINQLHGHEELDRLQRSHARFVNTGMMVTLLGAVVSDGLESGQIVSGVGGQHDFVAMAHALPGARSILQIRSTRTAKGRLRSNVVWSYGHTTIPRQLRDVVVTEFGIADLRGKTDEEVIQSLLSISDTHFQAGLAERAKRQGKLSPDWQLPDQHRDNTSEARAQRLAPFKARGLFPRFPLGTEMTEHEVVLAEALQSLQSRVATRIGSLRAMLSALAAGVANDQLRPYLERMGLARPHGLREVVYQRLLVAELKRVLGSRLAVTAELPQ